LSDFIYLVDPGTRELTKVLPVAFSDIGVKERDDLEEWVVAHPDMLGEDLLVITSEFSRFDRSSRRLDILALDKRGCLVVIELKLTAASNQADLQAIRYAAFCSTMQMDNVIDEFTIFEGCNRAEAEEAILKFLERDTLPELGNRPRIILAAGSMDDHELTSSVLWLRSFNVDISCVEITPYRVPGNAKVLLVPKVIIPLPEAAEYIVRVEKKEAAKAREVTAQTEYSLLWRELATVFNDLGTGLVASGTAKGEYMQLRAGLPNMHYEWMVRPKERRIDVAIHFENTSREINLARLEAVEAKEAEISAGTRREFCCEPWGRKWAHAKFHLPYSDTFNNPDMVSEAAELMKLLIERTLPTLREIAQVQGLTTVSTGHG
jgi:muconolactone delta-isomerase